MLRKIIGKFNGVMLIFRKVITIVCQYKFI